MWSPALSIETALGAGNEPNEYGLGKYVGLVQLSTFINHSIVKSRPGTKVDEVDGVGVIVLVGVTVGVILAVGVTVLVGVTVGVEVAVAVGVGVGVLELVGVTVAVGVRVGVIVGVGVRVGDIVGVGLGAAGLGAQLIK
jgi:hypothetical protein